ncbi:hypothetical protein GOV12_04210 [Candidatus Pacearchaeota archaeon]|nr:hypothetical protein [Candidatus Pacearchaeota archaeon]
MEKEEPQRYSIRVKKSDRLISLEKAFSYIEFDDDRSYREKMSFEDEKIKTLEPLVEYLNSLGLESKKDYSLLPDSQYAVAKLTSEQAEELRKQDYVRTVTKNYGHLRNEVYSDGNERVL